MVAIVGGGAPLVSLLGVSLKDTASPKKRIFTWGFLTCLQPNFRLPLSEFTWDLFPGWSRLYWRGVGIYILAPRIRKANKSVIIFHCTLRWRRCMVISQRSLNRLDNGESRAGDNWEEAVSNILQGYWDTRPSFANPESAQPFPCWHCNQQHLYFTYCINWSQSHLRYKQNTIQHAHSSVRTSALSTRTLQKSK